MTRSRQLESHGQSCWGMTGGYSVERSDDGAVVHVAMDSCCGTQMVFHISGRGRRAVITGFECAESGLF